MKMITNRMKSIKAACERIADAAKRELRAYEAGMAEADAYLLEHPDARYDLFQF